ncbi:hypothetical protein B0T18DRAFT_308726, partial [Schizothecium vesticola]
PTLLADSDRDGVVSQKDLDDRRFPWSADFGAIFLPNIGQTPPVDPANIVEVGGYIHMTNNASGNELLNPELAAPLRTVPLRKLSPTAIGKVSATASSFVRLFCRLVDVDRQPKWVLISGQTRFSQIALANGLILALDARNVVTDINTWDGTVTVNFDVYDPESHGNGHDKVMLRLAPLLFHHNLQPANLLLTRHIANPQPDQLNRLIPHANGTCQGLMKLLLATTALTGVPVETIKARNQWVRDHFSVAYCAMPGPRNRPVTIRVLLVLPCRQAPETAAGLFAGLCSPTVGLHPVPPTVDHVHGGQDCGGNIDVIPPYTSPRTGTAYPNGRLLMLMGDRSRAPWAAVPDPALSTLLASQGPRSQGPPLYIHADITAVGHIDEILTFLPDPRPGGTLPFTVVVIDPAAGLALLRKLDAEHHGYREVPRFPVDEIDGGAATEEEWVAWRPQIWQDRLPQRTVRELLRDRDFLAANERAGERVGGVLREVCEDVGIKEERVVRLPVVCYPYCITGQEDAVAFLLPNPVNGVVLGRRYLAGRQWGPVEGDDDEEEGEEEKVADVFKEAVEGELRKLGFEVAWVDDFVTLHILSGDVHCGTNTFREMGAWW